MLEVFSFIDNTLFMQLSPLSPFQGRAPRLGGTAEGPNEEEGQKENKTGQGKFSEGTGSDPSPEQSDLVALIGEDRDALRGEGVTDEMAQDNTYPEIPHRDYGPEQGQTDGVEGERMGSPPVFKMDRGDHLQEIGQDGSTGDGDQIQIKDIAYSGTNSQMGYPGHVRTSFSTL